MHGIGIPHGYVLAEEVNVIGSIKRRLKHVVLERFHRKNEGDRKARGCAISLPPRLWDLDVGPNGHLLLAGADLAGLAEIHGTPLYVIDKQRLVKNYATFLDAFKSGYPDVKIAYSYKTNPLPGALNLLHAAGADAEVISHFELWLALELGVAPARIIFNGPAKTTEALELAVARKVGSINIDSEGEIDTIARLAKQYGHRQEVGVRVVTSVGWGAQFGIPLNGGRAFAAFERLCRNPDLSPQGIHIHLGTGIGDVATYLQAIREVLDFTVTLKRELRFNVRRLDFGGGFGVPTVQKYSFWDGKLMLNGYPPSSIDPRACPSVEMYARQVNALLDSYLAKDSAFRPRIIFEPGRAISSSAQVLLVKVLNLKPGKGDVQYAIVDGGKNITSPLGYEQHEVFAVTRMKEARRFNYYTIVGPLCYPEDTLFNVKKLPRLQTGDVLAIMDAGAYFVPNQMNFSNPRPAAVVVENGMHQVTRERETFDHIVCLDRFRS